MDQTVSLRVQRAFVTLVCIGVVIGASAAPRWKQSLRAMGYYDADLAVQLLDLQQPVTAGESFEFVVEVSNQSEENPAEQTSAIISLGQDYAFVESQGCLQDPAGFPVCEVGQIDALSLETLTIRAAVDSDARVGAPITVVATSATGEANPGDETLEFTPLVARVSDLSASIVNQRDSFFQGGSQDVTYLLHAANAGPSDAEEVRVTLFEPTQLSGIGWSCFSSLGASCNATGTGAPDELVVLQAGAEVVYLIDGVLDVSAEGEVVAQAVVTPPPENIDPEPQNNVNLDIDPIALFASSFEDQPLTRRTGAPQSASSAAAVVPAAGVARVAVMVLDADDRPIAFWLTRTTGRAREMRLLMTDARQPRLIAGSDWIRVADDVRPDFRRNGAAWTYRVDDSTARSVSGTLEAARHDARRVSRVIRMPDRRGTAP